LIAAIVSAFTPATPLRPNKIWLFSASGINPKSDLFISTRETLIPRDVVSPIAFAIFA